MLIQSTSGMIKLAELWTAESTYLLSLIPLVTFQIYEASGLLTILHHVHFSRMPQAFSFPFQTFTDSHSKNFVMSPQELPFQWLQTLHILILFLEIPSISLLKLKARPLPKDSASPKTLLSGVILFFTPLQFLLLLSGHCSSILLGKKHPIDVHAISSLWKIEIQPHFQLLCMLIQLFYMENSFYTKSLQTCSQF